MGVILCIVIWLVFVGAVVVPMARAANRNREKRQCLHS
jgi:hypothetical protein